MPLSHLPPLLTSAFLDLAGWLHQRSAARLPLLLCGILFAHGRRTVTSWLRASGVGDEYRPAYTTVCACGRQASHMALSTLHAVGPRLHGGLRRPARWRALERPGVASGQRGAGDHQTPDQQPRRHCPTVPAPPAESDGRSGWVGS